jgi:hypothetical protein
MLRFTTFFFALLLLTLSADARPMRFVKLVLLPDNKADVQDFQTVEECNREAGRRLFDLPRGKSLVCVSALVNREDS